MLITACSNDNITIPTPPTGEEEQECTLTFTVNVPDMTNASRTLTGDASGIQTLKLLVFDGVEKNYLYERTANLISKNSTSGTYSVRMVTSSEPRIVHFVATHADKLDVPYQVSEFAVISQLYSEDNDAYWQRVEVPSITITKNNDNTETVTAENITNKAVTLVRNVARITLKSSTTDFVVDGFAIVNAPSKGSIAPYYMTPDANGNNFPEYVVSNLTTTGVSSAIGSYNTLIKNGYIGVPYPNGSSLSTVPAADKFPNSNVQYMYERTQEGSNAFLVVRRKMSDNSYRYYKIDILNTQTADGIPVYYKILRNFSYDITITGIDAGAEGFTNPEDAAKSDAADNNLTIAEELKELTNIAYNNERLFVSKTEVVCTNGTFLSFKFKYYDTNGKLNNNAVSFVFDEEFKGSGKVTNVTSKTGCEITPAGTNDDGFATISIPVTEFVKRPNWKEQKVTVKGTGILSREVNMILIEPYENSVGCSGTQQSPIAVPTTIPEIPLAVNSPVYVYFSLPKDMPESIFPLTFILAPEAHSITPNGANMPVVSLLNHENDTMKGLKYGFEKVVTWDEYKDYANIGMVVECPFKTSLAESATNIYVYNEYFNLGTTAFTNSEAEVEVPTVITVKNLNDTEISGLQFNRNTNSQSISISINKSDVTITEVKSQNGRYNCTKNNNGTYTISTGDNAWWGDTLVITASDGTTKSISLSYNW